MGGESRRLWVEKSKVWKKFWYVAIVLVAIIGCKKTERKAEGKTETSQIEEKIQQITAKYEVPKEVAKIKPVGIVTARLTGIEIKQNEYKKIGEFEDIGDKTYFIFQLPRSQGEWYIEILFYFNFSVSINVFSATGKIKVKGDETEIDITSYMSAKFPDDDGDGFSNLEEILNWTNPADNRDCPEPKKWYVDKDKDGFYTITLTCLAPEGAKSTATNIDCDDNSNSITTFVWYEDKDKDGYGVEGKTTLSCIQPPGYSQNKGDCNDNDPRINPIATEICGNNIDDNCNGSIDENCGSGSGSGSGGGSGSGSGSGSVGGGTGGISGITGHLGDVVWLSYSNPPKHSILSPGPTTIEVGISYSVSTTQSAIIYFSISGISGGNYWWTLATTSINVSGQGQAVIRLTANIPTSSFVSGRVSMYDNNYHSIFPETAILSYISSPTQSVEFVFVENESPPSGTKLYENTAQRFSSSINYRLFDRDMNVSLGSLPVGENWWYSIDSKWYNSLTGDGLIYYNTNYKTITWCTSAFMLRAGLGYSSIRDSIVYPILLTHPCLRVDPSWLYLSLCQGRSRDIDIFVSATSSTSVSVDENASWIDISPTSGTTPFWARASISTSSLSPGNYSSSIIVSNPFDIKEVDVNLEVKRDAPISLTSSQVSSRTYLLDWGPVDGAERYFLFESKGGQYTKIGQVSSGTTMFLRTFQNCETGTFSYFVSATGYDICPSSTTSNVVSITISAEPQTEVCDGLDNDCNGEIDEGLTSCNSAKYSSHFKSPLCFTNPCTSGALLQGRDNILYKSEPNYPNNISPQCGDGSTSLSNSNDIFIDGITLSANSFSTGNPINVTINVNVMPDINPSFLVVDTYYAQNITYTSRATWSYIGTFSLSSTGSNFFSFAITPTQPGYAAVRAVMRIIYEYRDNINACASDYNEVRDTDDLVFYVSGSGSPAPIWRNGKEFVNKDEKEKFGCSSTFFSLFYIFILAFIFALRKGISLN